NIGTSGDVEGRAASGNDERIQAHLPPGQVQRARKSEAMPDVKRSAAKLAAQVVGVRRKQRSSLAVGIVGSFAQRVTGEKSQRAAESIIETNEQLVLIKAAA